MSEVKKVGRPGMGPRTRVPWRAPEELTGRAEQRARSLGFKSLNAYLSDLVARDTGYEAPHETQEGLPFADVA
jgi:hypothetical protein